jgi:hypothetical protein
MNAMIWPFESSSWRNRAQTTILAYELIAPP